MSLVLVQHCQAQHNDQNKKTSKTNKMNRPSINDNFETLDLDKFKGDLKIEKYYDPNIKQSNCNWYKYKKETEHEIITLTGSKEQVFDYQRTLKNQPYFIFKEYYGKNRYIYRKRVFSKTTNIVLGKEYQFNDEGKLIKTIDHDEGWNFSYEEVMDLIKQKYGDKVDYSIQYAFDLKKKSTNDKRNYWEITIKTTFKTGDQFSYDLLKVDGNTGEILCHQERSREWGQPDKLIKEIVSDYTDKTTYIQHQGKDYTRAEWEAYEEKQWKIHCKKHGIPYTPKNQETKTNTEHKSKFIAEDWEHGDENTPKKKGFWDNLLG